jgi:thioredoxin-related protein
MLDKILDRAGSIAIIIACIVFIGVVVHKYLIADKRASALPAEVPIGKKLDLPDVTWEGNGHTVIIALQKGCIFCDKSASFYRRLNHEISKKRNISIVAVLPDTVEDSREHLKVLDMPFNEVRQSQFKSIGVSGTPTLLVADKTGTVINGWVGKLSSEQETEVLQVLTRLSQNN